MGASIAAKHGRLAAGHASHPATRTAASCHPATVRDAKRSLHGFHPHTARTLTTRHDSTACQTLFGVLARSQCRPRHARTEAPVTLLLASQPQCALFRMHKAGCQHNRQRPQCSTMAAAAAEMPSTAKSSLTQEQQRSLALTAALGLAMWCIPAPLGITTQGWQLCAIFAATMVGIITQPLPSGAVALMALGASVITGTLPFSAAFAAFSTEIPWLVLTAMFLAQSFTQTGLGSRLAYLFVSAFGAHPLGLAYSLVFSEALLAPAIPSVAARSGGILLPLVRAMSEACGSRPGDGTEQQLGAFLMLTLFQTSAVSSSLFQTSNHPNPLTSQLAQDATGVAITWPLWARAAALPGLLNLLLVPLTVWWASPPTMRDSRPAQQLAAQRLRELGPLSRSEKVMAAASSLTLVLWVGGGVLGVNVTAAAIAGLSVLLAGGVLSWDACLSNKSAWNTFTWFAAIIAFAGQLKSLGVISAVTSRVASGVASLGLPWQWSSLLLLLAYFYSHYSFASNLSHVSAMFSAFLGVAIAAGCPGMLAALVLMMVSNFMGGMSYWGMSHAPLYFGQGYVTGPKWVRIGLLVSVLNLAVWLTVGPAWWRVLGLW